MVQVFFWKNFCIMNLVNRGFVFVQPNKQYVTWALLMKPELILDEQAEGTVFLIEEEFWDDELIFKQYAKKIAQEQFGSVSTDETTWPKCTDLAEFETFFRVEFGCTCIDLRKEPLQKEPF